VLRLGKRVLRRQPPAPLAAPSDPAHREAERAQFAARPLVRALWPWLVCLELGAAYLVRVRWPLMRGEVVIAERYVLSALIELAARLDRPEIARSPAGRALRLLAPRPDRNYWLAVDPAAALARREDEESAAFLARQAAVAPALAAALGATRLDASRTRDELSDRIAADVLSAYEDEHRTALNALFCANPRPLPSGWTRADRDGGKA
jgi:hypothetical protein